MDLFDIAAVEAGVKRHAEGYSYSKAETDALLAEKANTDGSYDLMTVGEAKALVGRGDGTAQQFVFRPTGGNASVGSGKARIGRIKGNTVVWNQLVYDGIFSDISNWTVGSGGTITKDGDWLKYTVESTSSSAVTINMIQEHRTALYNTHKYYVKSEIKTNSVSTWIPYGIGAIGLNGYEHIPIMNISSTPQKLSAILTSTSDSDGRWIGFQINNARMSANESIWFKKYMVVDLTKMFGAGNEPSTAEEFEALYPNAYYDYNTGELVNVTATGIKTVGFNAYNPTNHTAELLGGKQYQITGAYIAVSYSTGETITPDANGKFTPSSNGTLTVTGYGADTCVHLVHSGYMDVEFEEYWDETKALPIATYFADGMKSAGSVYDELQGGKAIKRVGTRAYQSGDENDSSVVTDGTHTNYALATPVETATTTPLDLVYRVDDFGTEQEIATGTTAPFKADISYAMNAVDFIRNAPKNYISKESMDEFTAALGTALGKTITATWNATTNRYNFTITTPQV